jgi:hypothetical protein
MTRMLTVLLLAACGTPSEPDPGEAQAALQSDAFSIVALPDTQYYSGAYPWVFEDQTSWIVAHAPDPDKNIKLVLGLGDIVDGGGLPANGACKAAPASNWSAQWNNAVAAVNRLDGHVPYLFAIGNHDYDCEADRPQPRSSSNWDKNFGPARYAGKSWFNGAFFSGGHANFYNVFTMNGVQYLVLALEFYPRSSALAWADGVLSAHANMQAIIITHAYLFYDQNGPGTARPVTGGDDDSAASYKLSPSCPETGATTCGNGNNGSDLWTKLISQHSNVVLVLNGHFRLPSPGDAFPASPAVPANNGVGHRTQLTAQGTRLNEILSDYQGEGANGYFGNGYLRLYTFKPSQGVIEVRTYSPSVDLHPSRFPSPGIPLNAADHSPANFKTDAYNQFTVPYANPLAGSAVTFTPADGATLSSTPVHIQGTAVAPLGVRLIQLYVDGLKQTEQSGAVFDATVALAPGARRVTLQALDNGGTYFKSVHELTVQ